MFNLESFKATINQLINSSLWTRIFSWKHIIKSIVELGSSLEFIFQENKNLSEQITILEQKERQNTIDLSANQKDHERLKQENLILKNRIEDLLPLKLDNQKITAELNDLKQRQHSQNMKVEQQILKYEEFEKHAREREQKKEEIAQEKIAERQDSLKRTWQDHEENVNQSIRLICQEESITFIEEWPHDKKPDNVIKICSEYIVFDAKSPSKNQELSNFPNYIKDQVGKLSKYANHKDVKKHLFLVVPENTIHALKALTYNDSNYCVHIISPLSLKITMWSLKQIELYEFADKLSPEDRDNLARVFAGSQSYIKRSIQIHNDLNEKGLDLIAQNMQLISKDSLKVIRENALEFEKGDIINVSKQNRGKIIDLEQEESRQKEIKFKATNRTVIETSNSLKGKKE